MSGSRPVAFRVKRNSGFEVDEVKHTLKGSRVDTIARVCRDLKNSIAHHLRGGGKIGPPRLERGLTSPSVRHFSSVEKSI